ncbi:Cytochrome P450 3A13-like protein, partial [Dinothrombium tinctorium]
YFERKARFWQRLGINGPRALPILGNVIDNFFDPIPTLELKRYQKYGRVYGVMEFTNPVLTIGDPELIKQISVKDFHIFTNRLHRLPGDPFFSRLLLFLQNDDWKRVRCILNPAFTSARMKRMYTLMSACADNTVEEFERLASESGEINLKKFSSAQSFDTIIRCTLGVETNAHKDPNNSLKVNIERFLDFSSWRFIAILLLPNKLQTLLGIQQTPEDVLSFFRNSMSFILNERKNKNVKGNDILQLLMDAELDSDAVTQQKELNKADEQYFE